MTELYGCSNSWGIVPVQEALIIRSSFCNTMSQDLAKTSEDESVALHHEAGQNDDHASKLFPQDVSDKPCGCNKEGSMGDKSPNRSFVYAVGKIEPRFPNRSLEKEYLQAVGRSETKGQTDYEAMRTALLKRENRYLVRQMCWILKIEGLETYILTPRDPGDFEMLTESLRTQPRGTDVDVIVGVRGPLATPEMCNNIVVPIVVFDQIYSFDIDSLIKAIPKPAKVDAKKFESTAEELFDKIIQIADNVGAADEHRALNYLSVRYDAIYVKAVEMHDRNFQLDGVEVRNSRLSGTRKIVDVIFVYRNRTTDVIEKYFTRVDVTEEYPFLVSKLTSYYDRQIVE